jgi:hypothetical protein
MRREYEAYDQDTLESKDYSSLKTRKTDVLYDTPFSSRFIGANKI